MNLTIDEATRVIGFCKELQAAMGRFTSMYNGHFNCIISFLARCRSDICVEQQIEDRGEKTPLFRLLEKSVENTKGKAHVRKAKHSNANGRSGNGRNSKRRASAPTDRET